MKLRTLTSLLLFFGLKSLTAQNPTFDIGANIQYLPSIENTITQPVTSISYQTINDTTQVLSRFDANQKITKSYNSSLGYEIMTRVQFKINNKLSIKTGLGVNLLRLQSREQFQEIVESMLISMDTTIISPATSGTFTNYCDTYLNSISDLGGIDDAISYHLLNLRIPFLLSYELMSSKLTLNLGGYIQTPVYTSRKSESLSISRELINGEHLCTYTKLTDDDKSGGNVSNLQSGLSGSVEYRIGKNVTIEAGVLKDLDNLFYISDAPFNREVEDLSPIRYTIGLKYTLNNTSETEKQGRF